LWGTADAVWQTQINCNYFKFIFHLRGFLKS
jgi:hypothetical protein